MPPPSFVLFAKSCCDITFMAAVFSVPVAIRHEGLSAGWALVGIHRFSIDLLLVLAPPFVPAGIRAEFLLFSSWQLLHDSATVFAESRCPVIRFIFLRQSKRFQRMPSAKGLDGVRIQTEFIGNPLVPISAPAQRGNHHLVFFCQHSFVLRAFHLSRRQGW